MQIRIVMMLNHSMSLLLSSFTGHVINFKQCTYLSLSLSVSSNISHTTLKISLETGMTKIFNGLSRKYMVGKKLTSIDRDYLLTKI